MNLPFDYELDTTSLANTHQYNMLYKHVAIHTQLKGHILDVGCGRGHATNALRGMGYNVVGLDAIYNTVPCATKDKHGNAVFYPINLASSRLFYELPNVQHTIDTVMLAHTFRYMTDPAYVLGELRRRYNL